MKRTSHRGLDLLNFCNAGIQTGLGPFISIFYGGVRHWNPSQIGLLLACQSLAGVVTQTFVGNLFDESKHKRVITACAATAVSLGALGIAIFKAFGVQIAVELLIGIGVTVFPAATASFAMGLVDEKELPKRFARNEMFTHSGNVAFAIIAGAVGTALALAGIFYAAAVFAAGMAGAVVFIREQDINYEAARAGNTQANDQPAKRTDFRALFTDRRVILFTIAVVLFNASNGATLPLVGQIFSKAEHGNSSSWQTALAVLAAEIVMVGTAMLTGDKAEAWGRKPLFIAAFALLALRNALGVVSHAPAYLISLQAFDGLAAAIYGVLLKLVTADLAKGSGRFNVLQGAVQSSMALGVLLSNLAFGFIAKKLGFNASFIGLSIMAVIGGVLHASKMPETRSHKGLSGAEAAAH